MRKIRIPHYYLFRCYRAAIRGDHRASRTLILLAVGMLKRRTLPSKGLHRFFLRAIADPEKYAEIMNSTEPKKKRGRLSLDDQAFKPLYGIQRKKFFGSLPTEKNALMIAYLLSEGHPINEAMGQNGKESAVVLLSELVDRKPRALQNDYYRHKAKIGGRETALQLGKTLFEAKKKLAKWKSDNSPGSH